MIRRNSTMVSAIAQELRERISAGQLKPGQLLPPQKELAVEFDVGLSTVREAVQMLTAIGLVESRPGKGSWVPKDAMLTMFSPSLVKSRLGELNARQVLEARAVIEVALTKFAAERADPEELKRIENSMEAMKSVIEDTQAFVKADLDFHFSVAKAAHSEVLEQFYQSVRELLPEVITELVLLPKVKQESISLQENILIAIQRGDVEKARHAAQMHMEYIEFLLNRYE